MIGVLAISGYALALVVGAVLGVLGAGGATVTVPIFVYLFAAPPKVATVLSLGVVGGVGLLGLFKAWPQKEVRVDWAFKVALPSMAAVWLSRRWLLPLIPSSYDFVLMLAFSGLVAWVARAMLKGSTRDGRSLSAGAFMLRATGVGAVTGMLGAGGGFLIVPMLTEWAGLPFRVAASTSLLVIVLNSIMGIYSGWSPELLPWLSTLGIFSAIAAMGLWLGARFAARASNEVLRRGFAYFLLGVAALTVVIEVSRLGASRSAEAQFVSIRELEPGIVLDIRYHGSRNFMGRPVRGYEGPECLLARPAAEALIGAHRELKARGMGLRVYDCYRPQRAVDHFVEWGADLEDQASKAEYYPRVEKARLFELGYIAKRSGHSRGATVDLTIDLPNDVNNGEMDMGTPYDLFDELSHSDNRQIPPLAQENRKLLRSVMERQGFVGLAEEWWHFTYKPEPFPDRYFDFPVTGGAQLLRE